MKICPFCAEEIQGAAIVCKHCGRDLPRTDAAQRTSIAPRMAAADVDKNMGLGIFLLVAAVGTSATMITCAIKERASEQSVASVNAVTIRVTTDTIYAAYHDNEIAADQAYKGQRIRIAGRVLNVGKDIVGSPYVTLGPGVVPQVQAIFAKNDEALLSTISAGQDVAVECTCDGKLGWVIARKCVVAEMPLSTGR